MTIAARLKQLTELLQEEIHRQSQTNRRCGSTKNGKNKMLFLIEYDRSRGEIVSFRKFEGEESRSAEQARLELELDLNRRGSEHEVVLLEAEKEQALLRTHRRYFATLTELVND